MADEKELDALAPEEVKNELVRQYTKHNEQIAELKEEGVVRLKLVCVGAQGVGKTSFMNRLTKNKFNQAQTPTVGSNYFVQGVAIEDVEYNFDMWDVSGDERYRSLVSMVRTYRIGHFFLKLQSICSMLRQH